MSPWHRETFFYNLLWRILTAINGLKVLLTRYWTIFPSAPLKSQATFELRAMMDSCSGSNRAWRNLDRESRNISSHTTRSIVALSCSKLVISISTSRAWKMLLIQFLWPEGQGDVKAIDKIQANRTGGTSSIKDIDKRPWSFIAYWGSPESVSTPNRARRALT